MKFACLAYEDEGLFTALSSSEWGGLRRETLERVDQLRRDGHLVAAQALRSVRTARTVRIRGGKAMVVDGPFAETKEQLGGIIVIEARDLDEATRIAATWPSARIGSIEVRPIEETLREEGRY
jgi:hypothetical protein